MWDLMLTGGYTPEKIGQIASREWGLTTRTTKKVVGKPIGRSVAYSIFKNPFYCGLIKVDGELVEGAHEAMITKSEYDRVQKILGRNGNPRAIKKVFPFTGLMRCGECGCTITAEHKTKYLKGKNEVKSYVYYHCTKKKLHSDGSKCSQKCLETNELERQIGEKLGEIKIPHKFLEWGREWLLEQGDIEQKQNETIKRNLERKLKSTSTKMDNLIKLKISDADLLTDEEFKNQKTLLQKKKRK
jgi:site-specific DNA recombinase